MSVGVSVGPQRQARGGGGFQDAELERSLIQERTKAGHAAAVARGVRMGRRPRRALRRGNSERERGRSRMAETTGSGSVASRHAVCLQADSPIRTWALRGVAGKLGLRWLQDSYLFEKWENKKFPVQWENTLRVFGLEVEIL